MVAAEESESSIERTQKPRVLIVEDNDTDYLLLARQICKLLASTENERAANRSELKSALTKPWDLIVTDYHLIDIEGSELLNTIAAAHAGTPCLLLSGSLEELESITTPKNVFAKLEKGNAAGLRTALLGTWKIAE